MEPVVRGMWASEGGWGDPDGVRHRGWWPLQLRAGVEAVPPNRGRYQFGHIL